MSSLSISHIQKSFGPQAVLRGVNLEIRSGEFYFILGPSGCGKSTLLRIIAGLEHPDGGSISVEGRDITDTPPQKRGIGMVFQQYALWPHMTVEQNIRFGLQAQRIPRSEQGSRIHDALALVRMSGLNERYPHEISGGQQQRAAVARALALKPKILLLDEPLSNLDARLRDEIRGELKELHRQLGITIIYVTHDQEDALSLATRMVILRDGSVVQEGAPLDIYRHPSSSFSATFLGDANVLSVTLSQDGRAALARPPHIPLPARVDSSHHGPALVCVRPEFVRFTDESGALSGTLSSLTFRGAYQDFTVTLEDGTAIRGRTLMPSEGLQAQVGQRVSVSWHARDVSVMAN